MNTCSELHEQEAFKGLADYQMIKTKPFMIGLGLVFVGFYYIPLIYQIGDASWGA